MLTDSGPGQNLLPGLQTDTFLLCPHIGERERGKEREKVEGRKEEREKKGGGRERKSTASTLITSNKDTNSIMTSSKPSHLPEAPPPSTNTLDDRAPTYEFGGHTIHSIAPYWIPTC